MTDPAQPDEYAKLKAQKEAILLRQSPNKKLLSRLVELKELVENYHGVFPNRAVIAEALRDAAAALVSPPVQPVEATPLVDSAEWENSLQCSTFVVTSEFARHLERTLSLAIRQLALAQTENAGHIRIEDELKAELREVEKDAARYRWLRENSTRPGEPWSTHQNPESLDAAIDAAISAKTPSR